jgi:hypothetical protein
MNSCFFLIFIVLDAVASQFGNVPHAKFAIGGDRGDIAFMASRKLLLFQHQTHHHPIIL